MLHLDHIALKLPVVQVALSGYSDWPMRAMAKRMGAPYTICEVMIDTFVNTLTSRRKTKHFLMVTDDDHPVGAQLMGADPDQFPTAAVRLVEAGFDVVDINFGCPVKSAMGRCRGGFHLGQPDIALEIIRRVRDAVPDRIPVTVKMRRGVDETHQSRDMFFQILNGAFAAGVAAVTIHGRTVEQRYLGSSNWTFLKQLKAEFSKQTILGSGDLFSAEDCVRMIRETGVDGVTAARGAIGNPWIFFQAHELLAGRSLPEAPSVEEQRDVLVKHYELAESVYSSKRAVKQLRKFGIRYADWHPQGDRVRAAFIKASNRDMWHQVMNDWYATNAPGRYPSHPGRSNPAR